MVELHSQGNLIRMPQNLKKDILHDSKASKCVSIPFGTKSAQNAQELIFDARNIPMGKAFMKLMADNPDFTAGQLALMALDNVNSAAAVNGIEKLSKKMEDK